MKYPFVPKSSLSLTPGDFWGFKLKNDTWACGRVLQLRSEGKQSRTWFFGALLDWNGEAQPTFESIAKAKTFRQGAMRIDSIRKTGAMVLGNRPVSLDGIEPWLCISGNVIQRGYDYVRAWKRKDTSALPTFSYWGDMHIWSLANFHFVGFLPPDGEGPTLSAIESI
jgi:hypothetical protein